MRTTRVLLAAAAALAAAAPAASAAETPAHHPGSVLVTFEPGATAAKRASVHSALGSRVATRFSNLRTDVVVLPKGLDPVTAVARYERRAAVADATLNKLIRANSNPNDIQFGDQWGFNNTGQPVTGSFVRGKAGFDIDAPEAWSTAFGPGLFESSGGTLVADLDTGIDRGHVEFLNKVKRCAQAVTALGIVTEGACSDDNLHGTHTAGTIGALTNNTAGVAGTGPNVDLAVFKFLNGAGSGFLADEIAGLKWAKNTGAKVFSMSFGSGSSDATEQAAIKDAATTALLVAAAGNGYDAKPNYPAFYAEVMSVAATNQAGALADFSTCNGDVEISAPGEDVWSTFPGNSYGVISGTSMATPHVAGAAALVMSETGQTPAQVRSTLKSSAKDTVDELGRSNCPNLGHLNIASALGGSGGTTPPPPTTSPGAITGTVTDSRTKAALASATVDCGTAGVATTGTNGSYTLSSVPPATYSCTASKANYASKTASVIVSSGATTTASFALRPR